MNHSALLAGPSILSLVPSEVLPAYEPRTSHLSQHVFVKAFGGSSISLRLHSHAASPESVPVLSDLSKVDGQIELDLSGRTSIQRIVVKVRSLTLLPTCD